MSNFSTDGAGALTRGTSKDGAGSLAYGTLARAILVMVSGFDDRAQIVCDARPSGIGELSRTGGARGRGVSPGPGEPRQMASVSLAPGASWRSSWLAGAGDGIGASSMSMLPHAGHISSPMCDVSPLNVRPHS
jgi:hypothetical protein